MLRNILVALACLGVSMSVYAKTCVVDVRTPQEIAETGKVQNAMTADYQSKDFMKKIEANKIDKNDTVLLYCKSGVRAGKAKDALEKAGYKHVEVLGGYQDAAKKLNRPLEK